MLAIGVLLWAGVAHAQPQPPHPVSNGGALRTAVVAQGLSHPWGLAFLPDGRMLVTERAGSLRVVTADGTVSPPVQGLPPVEASGQGGLLDVALDPAFAENRWIYWSYAEAGVGGSGTAVARGRLAADGSRVDDVRVIFRQEPKVRSGRHFGSRLVFGRDGLLFITLGDRGSFQEASQDLGNHIGTVVRLHPDGRVPSDNPFVARSGARPEIWSYGHRNIQGAALHPVTGELWTQEHGPQGGDEVNIARASRNYGWPAATYGRQYGTGFRIGEEQVPGMEAPLTWWTPSIAPSGLAFYTGERHPDWRGNVLVGALRSQLLVRLELDGEKVVREERFDAGARIRDVRQGPDGHVYLLTDESNGRLLRVQR